ncbi:MAG: hypothetical protein METHSR3v1_200004 [Methanothrix sp.]|nr:MAG: hypothetical protein METHSR3v1_200004 [Methanothrix sp.]
MVMGFLCSGYSFLAEPGFRLCETIRICNNPHPAAHRIEQSKKMN